MSAAGPTPATPLPAARGGAAPQSPFMRIVADFVSNPVAIFGLAMLAIILMLALFAPLISPQNPYDPRATRRDGQPPAARDRRARTAGTYWLGTDDQGRDMLSAIFYGLRISIGRRNRRDRARARARARDGTHGSVRRRPRRDADHAHRRHPALVPAILIALILIAVLGQGTARSIAALVTVQWAYYARTVRGAALVEKRKEYMEAARCLALSPSRIVFKHLLPNCMPPMIVVATVQVAGAIALEATLSFPRAWPSDHRAFARLADRQRLPISAVRQVLDQLLPGIALLCTIVSINLVADQLRDVLNPRLQR
jgi:peptide/nickel transport system permease protein